MKKVLSPMNILLSLALVLFIISAAVVITLNFRPLYYFDIDFLGIEGMQWLTQLKEYEVGDIDQIVLGVDTRSTQAVLHPLARCDHRKLQ